MAKISIHDNVMTGYEVRCESCEIVLHTEFREREPREITDVVFRGVEAYHIYGDNMHTILFDVEEATFDEIFQYYAAQFEEGIRFCWPGAWNTSEAACRDDFEKAGCKAWIIASSYGATGFVVARTMELKQL